MFCYIDLSAVSQELKKITEPNKLKCHEAPSRARQLVKTNDVLVSTVRPNLNGVALVTSDFEGATASTGFCVLRPNPDRLNANYLFHWVKTELFVKSMVMQATGASYPAVSDKIVTESAIPLPDISEQRRIAAILDKADALRDKRREAVAQLNRLAQSIFVDMFGDPLLNPKEWQAQRLEDVSTKITDGEHLTPSRQESGIKLLSARNVRDGFLDLQNVDYVGWEEYTRISKRCNPEYGDILISCSGSIGRVAPVETTEPLAMVRSAALVKPDTTKVTSKYIEHWLRTPLMQSLMVRSAHSSSQANLFQGPIRGLPVLVPPIKAQYEFGERLEKMAVVVRTQQTMSRNFDALFASLQQLAFRGEL